VAKNITNTNCGVPVRDRAATYDVTSIVLAVISFGIATIRLGFKLFVTRSLSSDDYVVFVLLLFSLPSVFITHYGTAPNGVGRDIWTLTPQNITDFQFYFHSMAILYFIQVMLIKLCLLLFYLRIFPAQGVRRLLWGTVVFDLIFGIVYLFLAIFQCSPISYFWQGWDNEHEGSCLDKSAIAWSNAAISIALDIWMLAIPLAQLKALNLHWKKKIGVGLMFCVGTLYVVVPFNDYLMSMLTPFVATTSVTIVSIVRLQALVTFAESNNATWDNFPVSLWSTVEINVGIMCTCMPTLRLILVRLFPTLGGSSYAKGYYNTGGAGTGGAHVSGSRMTRTSQKRTLVGNLTGRSDHTATVQPGDSSDTVLPKSAAGIVRQQTFAVQYDDGDETSLVQMRAMAGSAPSRKSDDLA
jgi:hypothetical protein